MNEEIRAVMNDAVQPFGIYNNNNYSSSKEVVPKSMSLGEI